MSYEIKTLKFHLVGMAPLIMHSGQTADPMNDFSRAIKKISSKRNKNDADFEQMAKLEWEAGLYLDEKKEPCIPGFVLEAALIGKGGASRKVKAGAVVNAGLFVVKNFPLQYDGPRDIAGLWADERFRFVVPVKVQRSKVMRTRPIFHEWEVDVEIEHDPLLVESDDVRHWISLAGREVGLMDWRPRYGRFSVTEITV